MAQSYYTAFTVQSGQVPSAQSNFPALVSLTDARLKTTGNGGHVANSNGYDIRPYSDSALTTALTYELESYDGTTGAVVMHVKIPSINTGSVVYLGYGDTGLTTDGSSTSTWDAHYLGVYHLKDGTTLSVADSTGNNNGTNNGGTAATGKVGGGLSLDGSSHYVQVGTYPGAAVTYQAWAKPAVTDVYQAVIDSFEVGAFIHLLWGNNNGYWRWQPGVGVSISSSTPMDTGAWHFIVGTDDNVSTSRLYINGVQESTGSLNKVGSPTTTRIGDASRGGGGYFQGLLDEVRISDIERSADWILTEYNNQNAPSSFYSVGTETAVGGGGGGTPGGGSFFFRR